MPSPDTSDAPARRIGLCPQEISTDDISRWLTRRDCGAVVIFAGTARDHSEGRDGVTALEYEAYEAPALSRMESIVDEALARWPEVRAVAVEHRVGVVPVGSPAVVVGVASPHRDAAFEAARWVIDTVKATVPLWKKEFWPGGEAWAEPCHQSDHEHHEIPAQS